MRARSIAVPTVLALVIGVLAGGLPGASRASGAQTFENTAAIELSGTSGASSEIAVSGVEQAPKITATIHGLTHPKPGKVWLFLFGPTGRKVTLMYSSGGNIPANNVTLTFDDVGATLPGVTEPLVTGTYHPKEPPLPLANAPCNGETTSQMSTLNVPGELNGTWRLCIRFNNDYGPGDGTIAGGWSLSFGGETCVGLAPTIIANSPGDIVGTDGNDVIIGSSGNDTIFGSGGFDAICGGNGNDTINGGLDPDTLDGGNGNDELFGGDSGTNGVTYAASPVGVDVNLKKGRALGVGFDKIEDVNTVVGSPFDDVITGDDEPLNSLRGGEGDDLISGLGGRDFMRGDGGDDIMSPGDGNDEADGGDGDDVVSYRKSPNPVAGGVGTPGGFSGWGSDEVLFVESAVGSKFDDKIGGDHRPNTLLGGDGDDELIGHAGEDILNGEKGDDTLDGGEDADFLDGGPDGKKGDTVYYKSAFVGGVSVNLDTGVAAHDGFGSNDVVVGLENIVGSRYDDFLAGDAGKNRIEGWFGNDTLLGFGANDVLIGEDGTDTAEGGDGTKDRCDAESETTCEADPKIV